MSTIQVSSVARKTAANQDTSSGGLDFTKLSVKSLKGIEINITNKPFKISAPRGLSVSIFPRNGNLLFILEGTHEKLTVTIQPKHISSGTRSADFDKRKQAVINGKFEGTYLITIERKEKS